MSDRESWMQFIREEYDQRPNLGLATYPAFDSEWDDGAGRIADAVLADRLLLLRPIEQAKRSIMAATIGSCECNTKSPEAAYHAEYCRYLKLLQALDCLDDATRMPQSSGLARTP